MKEEQVPEDHIVFLNVVSAPEGIDRVFSEYPKIRVVTCALDERLNDDKYIVPVGVEGERMRGREWVTMEIGSSTLAIDVFVETNEVKRCEAKLGK